MKRSFIHFIRISLVVFSLAVSAANEQNTPVTNVTARFAGGCFWCMEADFEKLDGVLSVVSGYTGGHVKDPTYELISYTETGHYEAVEITYNPAQITYQQLLEHFWINIDPFDDKGQFCDKGSSYRTAIFPLTKDQHLQAKASLKSAELTLGGAKIVTPIIKASVFYPAEDYHQDYYKRNPVRYNYYRWGCGRDKRLEEIWGAPIDKKSKNSP